MTIMISVFFCGTITVYGSHRIASSTMTFIQSSSNTSNGVFLDSGGAHFRMIES